jgi:hypothetical protein
MSRFNRLCFLFAFFMLLQMLSAQVYYNQIAVLNLEAVGVSQNESITMTDRLRSELVNSGAFTVIERSKMDEILQEQGLQQTGCTSDECAVEIGKLLNIRLICAGSIGKVGALYSVSLRMIDVESSKILFTVTEDCRCPVEEVLTSSMKNIADKLVAASKSFVIIDTGIKKGDIYLKSVPSGAQIYINDQLQQERTPATLRNIPAGECLIKVVKGDELGSQAVIVKANEIVELMITLGRGKGGIKIYSTPAEAEIIIGEQSYGVTPKIIRDLPAGDYVVSLRRAGFVEAKCTVKVVPNEFNDVDVTFVKPATLYVTSTPSNAQVVLQGQSMGKTPLRLDQVNPERVLIEVSLEGYNPERKYLELQGGATANEHFTLSVLTKEKPKIVATSPVRNTTGSVQITNYLAGTTVYINGKKEDKIGADAFPLVNGTYTLKMVRSGYENKFEQVTIEGNQPVTFNGNLKPKAVPKAFLLSLIIPGWGQAYQEKQVQKILYPAVFFGSIAVAAFSKSEKDENVESGGTSNKTRDTMFVVAGVTYAWNLLDIFLIPPGYQGKVQLSSTGKSINLTAAFPLD